MKTLKSFFAIITYQTLLIVLLSFLALYLCLEYHIIVDIPTELIGVAVVFPIVFSINAAYRRRELALAQLAGLKGHAMLLFYTHRDRVPHDKAKHTSQAKALIRSLLQKIYHYFSTKDKSDYKQVHYSFSELSLSLEALRESGLSSSDVSRSNQSLRQMIIHFENMNHILIYRTPQSLRAYSKVFLNLFPILFAPFFATISEEYFYSFGFLVAGFYTVILICLDNIQDDLENPYDGIGEDDIQLDIGESYYGLLSELEETVPFSV